MREHGVTDMPKFLGKLIGVDEAINRLAKVLPKELPIRSAELVNSLGCYPAEDIVARIDMPEFDRSAVDGYAVRSIDVQGASVNNPAVLRIVGSMKPGDKPGKHVVGPGEAVEIHTGAPLPRGADAVVMYEDAMKMGDEVEVYSPVSPYANVSRKGEDFSKGSVIVPRGERIRAQHIGIIASNGIDRVRVYGRLSAAIISTGNELLEPGKPYIEGKIYASTGYLVKAYLEETGLFKADYLGIYPDDYDAIREAIEYATWRYDIVLTTGGTSVSESDVVRDVVEDLGEWVFRGVAMRPGRPTSLALVNNKPVLMLSGYPVAAWTGLELILRQAMINKYGLRGLERPVAVAVLRRSLPNRVGYTSLIRVRLIYGDYIIYVEPYMLKGSGILSSLSRSYGYVIIPGHIEGYAEGEKVLVKLIK